MIILEKSMGIDGIYFPVPLIGIVDGEGMRILG
jgi:hypothetical protein